MKKIISKILVVVMFVTVFAKYYETSKTEAFQQMKEKLIICCDQYKNRVVVYDISNSNKIAQKYVYNIPDAHEKGKKEIKEYNKAYSPTDAKLRMTPTGETVLLVTTGTRLYIFDYKKQTQIKKTYYYRNDFGDATINVHSVDMSRAGYVYIAEPNTGTVMRYKLTKVGDKYDLTKPTKKLSLPDAHSVLYDFDRSCLWAAGENKVAQIKKDSKSIKTVNFKDSNIEAFAGGHCLNQDPKNANQLYLTGNKGVIIISKKDYEKADGKVLCNVPDGYDKWIEDGYKANNIKGIVKFDNVLYYVRNENEGEGGRKGYEAWTTKKLRYYREGKKYELMTFKDNSRVYKITPFTTEY